MPVRIKVRKPGRPISKKRAEKKQAKGKGFINKWSTPDTYVKTKKRKKNDNPRIGPTRIVGKARPIKAPLKPIKKAQTGRELKKFARTGNPISQKKATKKVGKGKGTISKPIPNPQKSPGSYVRTKTVKKGKMAGFKRVVGKFRPIKRGRTKK